MHVELANDWPEGWLSDAEDEDDLGYDTVKTFRYRVRALLLEPVANTSGRYTRVGLVTFHNAWGAEEDGMNMGPKYNKYFLNTNLSFEGGEILRKPIPELTDVYEIEII